MNTQVQKRGQEAQSNHDGWVRVIAKERFPFPNREHPTWRTAINPGSEKNQGVVADGGSSFYPDIVVWDDSKQTDNVVMIAEIETKESVDESEVSQWREYSKVAPKPFFLYVPEGHGERARTLGRGTSISGFREYSNKNGTARIVNLN